MGISYLRGGQRRRPDCYSSAIPPLFLRVALWGGLEAHGQLQRLVASNDGHLELGGVGVEGLEEVVDRGDAAPADCGDDVAPPQAGAVGRAALLDAADEQPVDRLEPGRLTDPRCRRLGDDGDAEAAPGRRLAGRERLDPALQVVADREREVEALLEAVGVDADEPPVRAEHRAARRAAGKGSGVLEAAGDAAP